MIYLLTGILALVVLLMAVRIYLCYTDDPPAWRPTKADYEDWKRYLDDKEREDAR